jgi:hypothetical protein
VSVLTQLPRVVARHLERRITAQNAPPVIKKYRKSKLPFFDLSVDDAVDMVFKELIE